MKEEPLYEHLFGSVIQPARAPDLGCLTSERGCVTPPGLSPIPFRVLLRIRNCQDRGQACVLRVSEDAQRLVATGLVLVGVVAGEHGVLRAAVTACPHGSETPDLAVPDSIQRLVAAKMVIVAVAKVDGILSVVVEPTESGRRALSDN